MKGEGEWQGEDRGRLVIFKEGKKGRDMYLDSKGKSFVAMGMNYRDLFEENLLTREENHKELPTKLPEVMISAEVVSSPGQDHSIWVAVNDEKKVESLIQIMPDNF